MNFEKINSFRVVTNRTCIPFAWKLLGNSQYIRTTLHVIRVFFRYKYESPASLWVHLYTRYLFHGRRDECKKLIMSEWVNLEDREEERLAHRASYSYRGKTVRIQLANYSSEVCRNNLAMSSVHLPQHNVNREVPRKPAEELKYRCVANKRDIVTRLPHRVAPPRTARGEGNTFHGFPKLKGIELDPVCLSLPLLPYPPLASWGYLTFGGIAERRTAGIYKVPGLSGLVL